MLRIEEQIWEVLVGQLLARKDVETAAIILAEPLSPDASVLAARAVSLVPEEGYLIRRRDQLSIDPVAINRLVRPARERNLSIVTVHSHPGAREAWFSGADDRGDARLLPSFATQVPERPHGSIVVAGPQLAVGRLLRAGRLEPMSVRTVGRRLGIVTPVGSSHGDDRFARQVLALGADGQRALSDLCIGVVGLGGVGSVVAAQLAHLGIGGLVLVDGDVVESSNMSRIVGARPADVGRVFKTVVARRYAEELGMPVRTATHERYLERSDDLQLLAGCDVVLSCVDRHTPRALLNRHAYRALAPVIDMGTGFRVDARGVCTGSAGRVVVVGPGRPCLGCWGHIDPAALRIEGLSPVEREAESEEGYIEGADVPQPSVMPFNTMVAGAAVIELLRLATAFAGADDPPDRLAFRFEDGTVRRNGLAGPPECHICGEGRARPAAAA